MKTRIFLWTLMILYLGFMIGWITSSDYYKTGYVKNKQESKCKKCWQEAWKQSRDLNKMILLVVEGLWSEEGKITELIIKDGEMEINLGFVIAEQKDDLTLTRRNVMDISNQLRIMDLNLSDNAELIVRNRDVNNHLPSFNCGYDKYKFEYKER